MKCSNRDTKTAQRGLTLIEMIVVIAILGVLVGMAVPYISEFRDDGLRREQKVQMGRIQEAYSLWLQVKLLQEPGLMQNELFDEFLPSAGLGANSIVSTSVLDGNAGVAYLPYWTPADFRQNSGSYKMYDAWGGVLDGSSQQGMVLSSPPSSGASAVIGAQLPYEEVLAKEALAREQTIQQAVRAYYESMVTPGDPHPSGWDHYYPPESSATPNSMWLSLKQKSFLNDDPRWQVLGAGGSGGPGITSTNPPAIVCDLVSQYTSGQFDWLNLKLKPHPMSIAGLVGN